MRWVFKDFGLIQKICFPKKIIGTSLLEQNFEGNSKTISTKKELNSTTIFQNLAASNLEKLHLKKNIAHILEMCKIKTKQTFYTRGNFEKHLWLCYLLFFNIWGMVFKSSFYLFINNNISTCKNTSHKWKGLNTYKTQ